MNEFFDRFGTHVVMQADYGAKFVTAARFPRETYYKNKFSDSQVVFGTNTDSWGVTSTGNAPDDGADSFVPSRAIQQLAAYSLGLALPEAPTTAERLLELSKMREDIMESPAIVSNMRLISLPEYLMDMLKAEDPEGALDSDEARSILALGRHLETAYCHYLRTEGRIGSCEAPAEAVSDKMAVVLEATSTEHDLYKTTTVSEQTGSRTYYGHAECFREEQERGKSCYLSKGRASYTKHCKFRIEAGYVCRNDAWQSCWSGPWVWDACSFKKDGVTFHGECDAAGACVGYASVEVQADGQVAALERCE